MDFVSCPRRVFGNDANMSNNAIRMLPAVKHGAADLSLLKIPSGHGIGVAMKTVVADVQ